jgi:hypothetical protein
MGAALATPIEADVGRLYYEHSSGADATIRWSCDPGGRKKVE